MACLGSGGCAPSPRQTYSAHKPFAKKHKDSKIAIASKSTPLEEEHPSPSDVRTASADSSTGRARISGTTGRLVTGRQKSPRHVGLDPFLDQQQPVAQTPPKNTAPNADTAGSPDTEPAAPAVAQADLPRPGTSSPLARVQNRLSQDSGQPQTPVTREPLHSAAPRNAFVSSTWQAVSPQQDADPATVQRLRLRADTLLYRARLALKQNQLEEALQLAAAAERIENCGIPVYSASEERPFHLVRQIETQIAESSYAKIAARAVAENPAPANLDPAAETVAIQPRQPVAGPAPQAVQLASRATGAVEANAAQRLSPTVAPAQGGGLPSAAAPVAPPVAAAPQPVPHSAVPPVPGVPLPPANSSPILAAIPAAAPPPPDSTASISQSDSDPFSETIVGHPEDAAATGSLRSGLSWPALIGLTLGLAGLCGLLVWRRLERRYYATTK
jgi:hypothetical protein